MTTGQKLQAQLDRFRLTKRPGDYPREADLVAEHQRVNGERLWARIHKLRDLREKPE